MNAARSCAPLIALLSSLLLLPACGNQEVKPPSQKPKDPIFVGTIVEVPVREKCVIDMPPEPSWQVGIVPSADTSAFEKSKAVLAELEQRRDYITQLKAAAKKCE